MAVMIHRVVLGSMERFIGGLIEHYAGAFPLWLAPTQVVVMPITDAHRDFAASVVDKLLALEVRVELDDRNEKVNRKIRDAEEQKVPYMFIVGQKEIDEGTVSVRKHGEGDIGTADVGVMIERIVDEIASKSRA